MASRTVVTCCVMAILFAVNAFVSSLILALCVASHGFSIIVGIVVFVSAAVFIYLGFFKNDNGKLRWQYLFVAIISIFSGFILCFTSSDFHVKDSRANKLAIYSIVAASFTTAFGVLTTLITNKMISDVLKSGNMDLAQETTLYVILEILIAFLLGLSFILKVLPSVGKVFSKDFSLSIIVWVIAALIGAGVGYIFESKSTPLASAYDSNYDTNNSYDNIK